MSAHKANSGEENFPAAPAGIRTRNLSITSPAFSQQAIPVHRDLILAVKFHREPVKFFEERGYVISVLFVCLLVVVVVVFVCFFHNKPCRVVVDWL